MQHNRKLKLQSITFEGTHTVPPITPGTGHIKVPTASQGMVSHRGL